MIPEPFFEEWVDEAEDQEESRKIKPVLTQRKMNHCGHFIIEYIGESIGEKDHTKGGSTKRKTLPHLL